MRYLAIAAACLALAGCETATVNLQNATPTEQLLRSRPSERAAAKMGLVCRAPITSRCIPAGKRAFVEVMAGDDTPAGKYAVAAFEAHLSGEGAAVVEDRGLADYVVKLRIAAAGIEDTAKIFGFPSIIIPAVPGRTTQAIQTPELSLFSTHTRAGIVELYAEVVDAKSWMAVTAVGPLWAVSIVRSGSILTGISLGKPTAPPGLVSTAGR